MYVIARSATWTNAAGDLVTHVSYFKENRYGCNIMDCIDKALHYEFKVEAERDVRKYFPYNHKAGRVKIVKYDPIKK